MCTHCHYIYNKYIHKRILVPCGKCEECRQTKADSRAFRIRNSIGYNDMAVFITLSYDNNWLPVIKRSDLEERKSIPIYRRFSDHSFTKIGEQFLTAFPPDFDSKYLRSPVRYGYNDYVGVPYYKDVQNFFKRLRINLKRNGYNYKVKYYACTEVGPTTFRPHCHICAIIPKGNFENFRDLVVKSWPFANKDITFRNTEIARNCASYVASYVNSDSRIPKFFQKFGFRVRHSYSQNFGLAAPSFSPLEVLEKVRRGDLFYDTTATLSAKTIASIVPKYVINRLFPQFKGFSRIPPRSLPFFLQRIERYAKVLNYTDKIFRIDYSEKELMAINTSLRNKYNYLASLLNNDPSLPTYKFSDYVADYCSAWRVYSSCRQKYFYQKSLEEIELHKWPEHYDNINEVYFGIVSADKSVFNRETLLPFCNYNELPLRLQRNDEMTDRYTKMVKRRKVTNHIMVKLGYNV